MEIKKYKNIILPAKKIKIDYLDNNEICKDFIN